MMSMPLGANSFAEMNTEKYIEILQSTQCWVTENARTFRRFISSLKMGINIPELQIFELTRDYKSDELLEFLEKHWHHQPVGVVSEAGVPGMADPGTEVAYLAHSAGVPVYSVSGPSSLLLALTASGLNGQQFTFHGYAPVDDDEFKKFIHLASGKAFEGYSQAFIETPYRSDRFLNSLLKHAPQELLLCIACNIHENDGFIITKRLKEWKNQQPVLGKRPCIFILGSHKFTSVKG